MDFSAQSMREASSIGLIGACVSRDMREEMFAKARPHYIWRIATMSLMSPAPAKLDIALPDGSDKERLTLDRDINKTFDLDAVFKCPYVVIDFFRDMYGCLKLSDGRFITNGLEVQHYGAGKLGLDVEERIEAQDPRFAGLWMESFQRFCDMANRSDAQFLIVPVYQLATQWDESGFRVEPSWRPKQLVARNLILGYMQRIALASLRNALIVPILPETLELDPNHEFGLGPYHFSKAAYARAADMLETMPEYVMTLDADDERRAEIMQREMESWSSFTEHDRLVPDRRPRRVSSMVKEAEAEAVSPQPWIEMVLPLRASGGDHGSDLNRARIGLIPSLNTYCDPGFVRRLTIVVPLKDFELARDLGNGCKIPTRVIAEDDLLPTERIGQIPRRGWYIQQMIKLAYARICNSEFYLALSADMILINPLDASCLRDGLPPMTAEPASAHAGWWRESARLLGHTSVLERSPDAAFGIAPAFLYGRVAKAVIAALDGIAVANDAADWVSYLAANGTSRDDTWTDMSLYWTYLLEYFDPRALYHHAQIYFYTHYGWRAEGLLREAGFRKRIMFCILQSAFINEIAHLDFVSKLTPTVSSN